MGIDLNIASYAKMAAFSLIAEAVQNFVIFVNKINLSRKKSHHVSYSMIAYLCMKYEEFSIFHDVPPFARF